MQNRALLGWFLVGGFCASVSCGGSNGGGVPGFGLACETDQECSTYDLLCDTAEEKCVECFSRDDCTAAKLCVSGKCEAPKACEDSRDCPSDQVCNEKAASCVECLENRDCGSGQKCAAQTCVDADFCEFTSDCEDGLVCDAVAGLCVACRNDRDCSSQRVCEDNECVLPGTGGTGGDGGTAGTDTGGSAGNNTGGTRAGSNNGGSAGSAGSAGSSGSGGMSGSGGTDPGCECSGLNEVCAPDERCVNANVVDDLFDCDDEILAIEGRSGPWAGDADTGINLMRGFGDPGSGWSDRTCAAWATCGPLAAGGTTFAFIGFMLNDGDAYSLVGYTGLQVQLESANIIQVILKTTGGGYFQYQLAPIAGSNLRTAPFGSMTPMNNSLELSLNLATVYEVQFSPTTPASCGYAIHRVVLY